MDLVSSVCLEKGLAAQARQHEVVLPSSLWLRMMELMHRHRYDALQRSAWIEEALLLLCICWPALSSTCDSAGEIDPPNGLPRRIKTTVHAATACLVAMTFFRPSMRPSRGAYSRVVQRAVRLRINLGIKLPEPPGLFVRLFLHPDAVVDSLLPVMLDLVPELRTTRFEWFRSSVHRTLIHRNVFYISVVPQPPVGMCGDEYLSTVLDKRDALFHSYEKQLTQLEEFDK